MTTTRALMLVAALVLALADTGWAADTDVENPEFRELPLQRGPIAGGRKHQPTPSEIQERAQTRNPTATAPAPDAPLGASSQRDAAPLGASSQRDELYERVLRQSQHSAPRAIDPDQ
jgi:hypothetical protein